jgi:flagellar assembly factor FliW
MPIITDTRFGAIDYDENDVIRFPEGIVGFPDCRDYLLVAHKPESNFRWLQSLDEPRLAFLVTDPAAYVDNYDPVLGDDFAVEMGIDASTPTLLLTTVSIPRGKPEEMTLNLAGPIVINVHERVGRQFILDDEAYTVKHRAFPESGTRAAA